MLKEIICNLCGSAHNVVVFSASSEAKNTQKRPYLITETHIVSPVKIVKCVKCGLVFVTPREDAKEVLSQYHDMVDEKYLEEETGRRKAARIILKKLNKYRKYGNRLLDIGCCTGFLLDEARRMGWEPHGVEVSAWAAGYAKKNFELDVSCVRVEEAKFPAKHFDAVVLSDTIEHLLNPRRALEEIRRILKPTGVLYVNTPNIGSFASRSLQARWWGINQFHLFYFSKQTLAKMLEASGFEDIHWSSSTRFFTLQYLIERFQGYNRFVYKLLRAIAKVGTLEKKLLWVNVGDQMEAIAKRSRSIEYLEEIEQPVEKSLKRKMKTIVVLPAYNAAKTLKVTFDDIPKELVDDVILVDDCSSDNTIEVAKELGITTFMHEKNRGYGGNQKTCYSKALHLGADIVVMVHPDYQYDPRLIPELIAPIKNGEADAVFGSRMMKGGALIGGMPPWKHNTNILLTALANVVLNTYFTEYHSGFRAYSAKFLRTVRFQDNSNGFIFDFEIIVQAVLRYLRIEEIPIRTRYFNEASTIKLWPSIVYGLGILKTLFKYILQTRNLANFKQFSRR